MKFQTLNKFKDAAMEYSEISCCPSGALEVVFKYSVALALSKIKPMKCVQNLKTDAAETDLTSKRQRPFVKLISLGS